MNAVPWTEIAAAWGDRDFRLLRDAVEQLDGVRTGHIEQLFGEGDDGFAQAVLAEAFAAVEADPDARVLLGTWVYSTCLAHWESATDSARIHAVLGALSEVVGGSAHSDRALQLLDDHGHCLRRAMAVENALHCSCPVEMHAQAGAIVEVTTGMLDSDGADHAQPEALFRAHAETQRVHYSAVRDMAEAVMEFFETEPAPGILQRGIDALNEAEGDPAVRGDVYESELRGHRAALTTLDAMAQLPRIAVGSADVVYLYPFALIGTDRDEVIERVGLEGQGLTLGGQRVTASVRLMLTDVWEHPDGSAPFYSGWELRLPDVSVTPAAGEEWTFECQVELRLSRLGNHSLRVTSRLADTDLNDLNQTMRRGSGLMGDERLRSGQAQWGRFVDYAAEVISDLAAALGARPRGDPDSDFHEVVVARALTIQYPGGDRETARAADLAGAVGGTLLLSPVRNLASSVVEWARYPPPAVENLMQGTGFLDDVAVRTANTTMLYTPVSPDWTHTSYVEMAELVATMPPLLAAWEDEIVEAGSSLNVESLTHAQLLRRQRELRSLENRIRQDLARLHSRRMVRHRVHREFIDRLWVAAGLDRLEGEFERQVALIGTQSEELTTFAATLEERKRRETRTKVELVLGVIAVVSVTSFFSWLNDDFGLDTHWVSIAELSVLVGLILAVVVIIILGSREEEP
jgi:hypothetical protein